MPTIEIRTSIRAPIGRVFDLCRSVEAHLATAARTDEVAIDGVTSGLMALGDEVTWSARHLGRSWTLGSRITSFDPPHHFRDSMTTGVFARFDHDHFFASEAGTTQVRDVFDFTSPLGPIGAIANVLVVTRHLRRFLVHRMERIRALAESADWKRFLGDG